MAQFGRNSGAILLRVVLLYSATLVNLTLYPGARSAVLKTNAVETAAKALMGTQAQQSAALALLQVRCHHNAMKVVT